MITNPIVLLAVQLCFATESNYGQNIRTSDGGRAIGAYQIWPSRVREVNHIAGRRIWTLGDRENTQLSRAMCLLDLNHRFTLGTTNVIDLASRWRNPKGDAPEWHLRKLRKALHELSDHHKRR